MTARLLVVGLDGATFSVLDQLGRQLPHLHALRERGHQGILTSTSPPATLPAWRSFLTGVPPSVHGQTDMFEFATNSYNVVPARPYRQSESFLTTLSKRGLRVCGLGVPGTYPPEEVNGIMVSGFDSPGALAAHEQSVWPQSFWPELRSAGGWRYAVFNEQQRGDLRTSTHALLEDLRAKQALAEMLLQRESWDLFFVHVQATDTVGHHLWHTYDTGSPRFVAGHQDLLPMVYQAADAFVGALTQLAGPHAQVLVVSDHGMGSADSTTLYLNRWLESLGMLSFNPPAPGQRLVSELLAHVPQRFVSVAMRKLPRSSVGAGISRLRPSPVDYSRTRVFSTELDYAPALWINRREVFPQGQVESHEAPELKRSLAEAALTLRHPVSGAAVFSSVEVSDEQTSNQPDLRLIPAWHRGCRVSMLRSPSSGSPFGKLSLAQFSSPRGFGMPGVHTPEGIYISSAPTTLSRTPAPWPIHKAADSVFELLGESTPHGPATSQGPETAYTPAEEAALHARLAQLGYIE